MPSEPYDVSRLPVIVGLGGVNAAGRLSLHHAYRRMVIDALPAAVAASTYRSLAGLMNIHKSTDEAATRDYINAHTLVRKIESLRHGEHSVAAQRHAQPDR